MPQNPSSSEEIAADLISTPASSPEPEAEPKSKRERLKRKAVQLQQDWKGIAYPEGKGPWFAGQELACVAPFDPATFSYTEANAWWLVELCRLAYTPDHREKSRPWSHFDRQPYLQGSPFREIHSLHKTGTHAAIYRVDGDRQQDIATVLCFRGTTKTRQWVLNLSTLPVEWQRGGGAGQSTATADQNFDKASKAYVHQGFQILFDRIWPLLEPLLRDQPRPLFITGHSLGGALALMTAALLPPEVLYTFGSPRVGNPAFTAGICDFPHHRVVHRHDIVTLLPHALQTSGAYDFCHHGDLIHLRSDEVDWQPDKPLTYLRKTFTSAHPPQCFVDHTPSLYADTLIKCSP